MKNNFKVGQKYRVAIDGMRESGNIIEITNICKYFYTEIISYKTIKGEKSLNSRFEKQSVFAKSLKLIDENQSIHIYQKGNEVHAILKKGKETVKKSVAKCSKDDEFDFKQGAELAFDRLFKEPYNTKLICVDENGSFAFTKGKIYEVKDGFLYGSLKFGVNDSNTEPFKSLDQINKIMASNFIELVE